MAELNPEHICALLSLLRDAPYFSLLGIRVSDVQKGYARVEMDVERKLMNPFGSVHGGAYASALDAAAYWAAYGGVEESAGYTTIDLSVSNLAMAREGRIIVEGRALKQGRSICLCEAEARDEGGRLLSFATSKLMVLSGKQSVGDLLKNLGRDALPPKFL